MKICFIGLGSIGKRHIKNLINILEERKINFQIDVVRSSTKPLEDDLKSKITHCYFRTQEIPKDYDIIFITNPTFLHYNTLLNVIDKTKHIFIEKPIFEDGEIDVEDIPYRKNSIYYVACPLRHTPVIKYIKKYIENEKVFSVRSICSSYLPNWRNGIDYRNTYSAVKEQGGGVTLDLIHEWDYLIYLFGIPKNVINIKGKYSELEINSDDLSVYIAKYNDKLVELHLDYFGRKNSRELVLYTAEKTIKADIAKNKISFYGENEQCVILDNEDMYRNEMNYFIDLILYNTQNINDIRDAYRTLKTALKGSEE
jgi:predicted dehydrogenase